MNEWEFTADIASRINETLKMFPDLPFSRAKVEQRGSGSNKRRDLTILDKSGKAILSGEIKLPYQADGGTPFNAKVVQDARTKGKRAGTAYFFTWNVNKFVLWETTPLDVTWRDQNYQSWNVTAVERESHMDLPMTEQAILGFLSRFLHTFADIVQGTAPLGTKLPDEKFVEILESHLERPIMLTQRTLQEQYQKPKFKAILDGWMRDDQGWVIRDDPEGVRDNLERAAMFSCYALVNKLVFHEALLKPFGSRMDRLVVPDHISTGEGLREHLETFFSDAKEKTGDYETVFGEDPFAVGLRIPFYSDLAVPLWRDLVNQIHKFDFSKLDYEIIGSLFERLIGPEERHKYGQFYTRVEVVDLINSFCIRTGEEKVMDPACGGGTFLVRAYARKKVLQPGRTHGEILADLFGADTSLFATHLTTINLATRHLVDQANYPQIARSDFFDLQAGKTFVTLPKKVSPTLLGKTQQHREIEVPDLDAVVGNPPYIRQEDIRRSKRKAKDGPESGTKEYYHRLIRAESGANFSGRSDIHCFFWPHAATFLKKDGYLCFLTSSQWLDVEYGFKLQEWLLRNFEIVAILESIEEPWFVGARVATTITILKRQPDEDLRMKNAVRFVQLRRPIRELLEHDGTTPGAVREADRLRDEILGTIDNISSRAYRIRLVTQQSLWRDGVKLGKLMGKSSEPVAEDTSAQSGEYYGGKWGMHLRAPDIWFKLLDEFGERLVPLGELAEIRFGVKSGRDEFFFPKDCSRECLDKYEDTADFLEAYGVPRKQVKSGKIRLALCGEGLSEIRPIESKYLESEAHSLMEIDSFVVSPEDCTRSILLVSEKLSELRGTYVHKYIKWGERQGYHKEPTCASRATAERQWYDLSSHLRPDIILPKIQQYRLIAFLNPHRMYQNSSLLGLYNVDAELTQVICGVLNSTWAILSREIFARQQGNEGNIQLDVYSANMMLVPHFDPHKQARCLQRIVSAFGEMKKRKVLAFLSERRLRQMAFTQGDKVEELKKLSDVSELDMDDRTELDDAVLELMGVRRQRERDELRRELYSYMRDFFEWTRQKEERAIENKKVAHRRNKANPADIANQIFQEICDNHGHILKSYKSNFLVRGRLFDAYRIPETGRPEYHSDFFTANGTRFTKGNGKSVAIIKTIGQFQDDLLILLTNSGMRGLVRIPHEEEECRRVLREYAQYVEERNSLMRRLIEERTADEEMQQKIFDALLARILEATL